MGNHRLYPAADACQRPLRSRFQARLTASVRLLQIRSVLSLWGCGPCAHLTWTFSGSIPAIPASPLTFLYGLCRKALSVPFDDPLSVLDATGVANIDAIRGCKPFLVPV